MNTAKVPTLELKGSWELLKITKPPSFEKNLKYIFLNNDVVLKYFSDNEIWFPDRIRNHNIDYYKQKLQNKKIGFRSVEVLNPKYLPKGIFMEIVNAFKGERIVIVFFANKGIFRCLKGHND